MAIVNRYENFEFPQYRYRPYPKQVTLPNGKTTVVKDELQHNALLESLESSEKEAIDLAGQYNAERLEEAKSPGKSNDKEALLEKCGELGIVVDKRWNIESIKNSLARAEAAREEY